jgi:Fe-S-cluster containining protein
MEPLPLSRSYTCRFGAPVLDHLDPAIFRLTYFAECMSCTFCHDACCQYGADIEMPRVAALERYQAELEQYVGAGRESWFRDDPEDVGILVEAEYPGGAYTRTQFQHLPPGRIPDTDFACVFLDVAPGGRGCLIHRFALERGIDVHEIKPLVCLLFPLSFDSGKLKPAYEFEVDDLICQGPGPSLYQAAREDVRWYFGSELVAELDRLERHYAAQAGRPLPLQMSS